MHACDPRRRVAGRRGGAGLRRRAWRGRASDGGHAERPVGGEHARRIRGGGEPCADGVGAVGDGQRGRRGKVAAGTDDGAAEDRVRAGRWNGRAARRRAGIERDRDLGGGLSHRAAHAQREGDTAADRVRQRQRDRVARTKRRRRAGASRDGKQHEPCPSPSVVESCKHLAPIASVGPVTRLRSASAAARGSLPATLR